MEAFETDVLTVGSGPAGLVASHLLVRAARFIAWRSAAPPNNSVHEPRGAMLSALGCRG